MAINLQKGQRISLTKEAPGLTKIICGLGWDIAKKSGGGFFSNFGKATQDYDLDAAVICLDEAGKLKDMQDLIYFANLSHQSGAIVHQGDNLTGEGDGDDEVIIIDLAKIPAQISKLVFTVNIYDCVTRNQDFSQVENSFVRLVNMSNNLEMARFNLSGKDYAGATGLILAEVYRHNGEWKMGAIGNPVRVNGLGEILKDYIN
jgi:tellurium resistance protein TerD